MCIIIAKEEGDRFDLKELKSSMQTASLHNCHGAGFAVKKANTGMVHLSKGYLFYYDLMLEALEQLDIQTEDEVMIHLRFATSGNINKQNCHPYVVSKEIQEIRKDELVTNTEVIVAHNGTFPEYVDPTSKVSDTVNFIQLFLAQSGVVEGMSNIYYADPNALDSMIGLNNRLCLMFPNEQPMLRIGNWNKLKEGTFHYSNYYHSNAYNGYVKPGTIVHNSNPYANAYNGY